MSDLEVDVLDELGRGWKFLIGSPQLVPEVSPWMATGGFFGVPCGLDRSAGRVLGLGRQCVK